MQLHINKRHYEFGPTVQLPTNISHLVPLSKLLKICKFLKCSEYNFLALGQYKKFLIWQCNAQWDVCTYTKECNNGYTTWAVGQYRNYCPREDKKIPPSGLRPLGGIFFCPPSGYNSYIALQPM